MPRKQKKYHHIYKTTNLINGKYYIGMHSTDNLNDGYMGSGKFLWYSIRKYGIHNFKHEILEVLPDRKSLVDREEEIVNDTLLCDPMCMNLNTGGAGGFHVINNNGLNNKVGQCLLGGRASAEKLNTDDEYRERHRKSVSENGKRMFKEGKFKPFNWLGRNHTEQAKQNMRKSKNVGETNSQFGTCWITNGTDSKKIKTSDTVPQGWLRGRTLK